MSDRPFDVPLSHAQFVSALHKGLGRALLHVRAEGVGDAEDAVVDACLHDRSYDPQVEGDRTPWLMEIFDASRATARLAQRLIPELCRGDEKYWDATQHCKIARELARRGYTEARTRLYAGLQKSPDSMDVVGAPDIIALDGADGLLHVVEYLGRLISEQPGQLVDDGPLYWFDEDRGEGAARRVLDAASAHSPAVASYLRHIDDRERERQEARSARKAGGRYKNSDNVRFDPLGPDQHDARMRRISAAAIVHEIETTDPEDDQYWFSMWGRRASEESLSAVFSAMLTQKNPGRLCQYLRVFSQREMAVFDPAMLQYADHEHPKVRKFAYRALSNYVHPEVRRLALERVEAGRVNEDELGLFKKNYRPGDVGILEKVMRVSEDRQVFHSLVFDLVAVFESNELAELARVMLFVYEESPCSFCRYRAVKSLMATKTAPKSLLEECEHDCLDETRERVLGVGLSQ
jgi:hypothetical protein